MNKEKLTNTIKSIYNWPISDDAAWTVYNNLTELAREDCLQTIEYLKRTVLLDSKERKAYRNHIATKGFELRPDELNQYILILMIVLTETVKVN